MDKSEQRVEMDTILFGSDSDYQEVGRNVLSATGTKDDSLQDALSPAAKNSVEEAKNESSLLDCPQRDDDEIRSM